MPRFVVYEIWTRSHMVTAETMEAALEQAEPGPAPPFIGGAVLAVAAAFCCVLWFSQGDWL